MMFKKIKKLLGLDDIKQDISSLKDSVSDLKYSVHDYASKVSSTESKLDKLDNIDKLTNKINELIAENVKLKEENSIYLKYYDINSEATDEIKKEVFKEFEIRKLQKVNEALETQLQYSRYTAAAAGMTALCAYNSYRPWGY